MGICHQCYQQSSDEQIDSIKTLNLKAANSLSGINFTFTNKPLHELKGDCLVFYLDHCSELRGNVVVDRMHKKARRKIMEYLVLAEQQVENTQIKHTLVPLTVSSLKFKNILFVKMRPWDGQSKQQVERQIYNLTISYLQVFRLRKFKSFTIVEFDPCLGIHHSIGCAGVMRAVDKYSRKFKDITIVCNSHESMDYYYRNFCSNKEGENQNNKRTEIYDKKGVIKDKKDKQKEQMFF